MSRFRSSAAGVDVRFEPAEIAILSRVPELIGSVGSGGGDPATARLHPAAYPDDEPASQELIRFTRDEITAARNADLEVFGRQLPDTGRWLAISADDAEAWIRVLGAARVILAARRGLFEVDDLSAVPIEDPDVALVNLLGAYQQELSEALLKSMDAS